ncbi:Zinc finger, U1-type [Corchorus capsularis]|uniref:Zinc finger, U1-type n=1 Tax=Corchorus capsularis TaxID=210143 RepID=A0A1R3IRU2_COCAP|nr:Zinc finger, U1-type [Corchorus capsularis]
MKLTVVCWLMIPGFDGAFYVYNHIVHPCLYVDMQTIINWLKKQLEFYLKDDFLAEADKYVKAHGPEALEKLIASESKGRVLQKDIKPVQLMEEKEIAAVKAIPETEPNASQTQAKMFTVACPEIKEKSCWVLPEIPSDKQVQKEWTCALCQVTTTCEQNLKMHLEGRRHKAACEELIKAKNQPSKAKVSPASAVEDSKKEPEKCASSCSSPASQKKQQPFKVQVSAASVAKNSDVSKNDAEKCATSNGTHISSEVVDLPTGISDGNKADLPNEEPNKFLANNTTGNRLQHKENVQDQQQIGTKHAGDKNPQFQCTICNISCARSEDLNCHRSGKKHKAKVSATSVAKNSDVSKNDAEKCAASNGTHIPSKAVDLTTGISNGNKPDLPNEEPNRFLANNMAGNQLKHKENVQDQQQIGKIHAGDNNPQFRCTICHISCTRLEDMNCHLSGKKHLAKVSAASVAKNSDVSKNDAEKCATSNGTHISSEVVDLPTGISDGNEADLPNEEPNKFLANNTTGNRLHHKENVQDQQQIGTKHAGDKNPQFQCTICNISCARSEDLNCHHSGKKHKAKVSAALAKVSATSVAKKSDVTKNDAEKCATSNSTHISTKAVDLTTGISNGNKPDLPNEEQNRFLANNMAGNQLKHKENVQDQQQIGKIHAGDNNPQFQCIICNISCTGLENLNCHLSGKKHLAKVSAASVAKNTDVSKNNAEKCASSNGTHISSKAVDLTTGISNGNKPNLPNEETNKFLANNMTGYWLQVQHKENVPDQQQIGTKHARDENPQFQCTICNISCSHSEDLNCHLSGKKHLAKVSAASVAKNSDVSKYDAEKCATSNGTHISSKAVDLTTGVSNGTKHDLPNEEPNKLLPNNMAGNQLKHEDKENVQDQQQIGKKHAGDQNPQFQCTICNVSCTRSEDLNCHLWGKKHLAQIQALNSLGQGENLLESLW